MAHHFTQVIGQFGLQLAPHLAGTAAPRTLPAPASSTLRAPASSQAPTTQPQRQSPLRTAKNSIGKLYSEYQVPSEQQFYEMMDKAVQPGALVFWSALGGPVLSSQEAAKDYAAYYNKQLLRPLIQKVDKEYPESIFNRFKKVDYPTYTALVDMTWSQASRAFARHAKGFAVVVLKGPPEDGIHWPSDDDCWAKDEYVKLTEPGSQCTGILRVDADNWKPGPRERGLKGKMIWVKGTGVLNPPQNPQ